MAGKFGGRLTVTVIELTEGAEKCGMFKQDTVDPFVVGVLHDGQGNEGGSDARFQTQAVNDAGGNAYWGETFQLLKEERHDVLRLELRDKDFVVHDVLGKLDLDLNATFDGAADGETVERTVVLVGTDKGVGKGKNAGNLKIALTFKK